MGKLIDAEALKAVNETSIAKYGDEYYTGEMIYGMRIVADYAVNHMPTIDAEPVIRCKNCVFWGTIPFKQRRGYCKKYDHYARGKDYCAWAERKTE